MKTDDQQEVKPNVQDWLQQNPGKTLNDYFRLFGTTAAPLISSPSNNYNTQTEYNNYNSQQKSNYNIWPYLLFSLFVIIAFFSNPKSYEHQNALKIRINGIVEELLGEETDNLLSIGLGKTIINVIIDQGLKSVSTDNYLFFSLTKLNYGSKSKVIGIGFLGKVYISNKINKEEVKKFAKQLGKKSRQQILYELNIN